MSKCLIGRYMHRKCFLIATNMRVLFYFFIQITQLKIDNNPFAKGFRDSGAGKREKK